MRPERARLADHHEVLVEDRPVPHTRRQCYWECAHALTLALQIGPMNNYQPRAPQPRRCVAEPTTCRPYATSRNSSSTHGESLRTLYQSTQPAVAYSTSAMVLLGATAASTGEDFSQHVRTHAQTTGFDGLHNPG